MDIALRHVSLGNHDHDLAIDGYACALTALRRLEFAGRARRFHNNGSHDA